MIRQLFSGALVVLALTVTSPAWAQGRAVGERLIAQSGAPERFTLEVTDQSIVIIDRSSGLRCSMPPNATETTLTVSGDMLQCGYTGGVYSNWMVVPTTAQAGQVEMQRFVGAYALFQKEQHTAQNLQPVTAPPIHPALQQIFPNAPTPFRVWMQDANPGADFSVSLIAADVNGHRVMQMIAGQSDTVNALSDLSFFTSTATPQ
ncbi:MAG: hypothetical protein ABL871_10130 [Terricaulis sp.]